MEIPKTEVLVTVEGRAHANLLLEPGEYFVGSGDGCEVRCRADQVSDRHAKLTINFDSIVIEDLGSSSGTHVNGKRVTETTRLWPNQKIQLGTATLSLRRMKTGSSPGHSIAPQTAMVHRVLPEEFLRDRKYEIGGVIAQGGMGAILDAKEATTARTVAMKVMLDTNSPEVLIRFVTEAKITAQLEHPGIVPVYELSVDENDQVFYTMKFVRGLTLRNIVESLAAGDAAALAKYPLVQLVTIFQKVCDAIAFAHSRGIIHRDLKPENVMVGDFGEVLVMDWGLAKVLDPGRAAAMLLPPAPVEPRRETVGGDSDRTVLIGTAGGSDTVERLIAHGVGGGSGMTMEGAILGTPQFMAPEQAAGLNDQLDRRADIYSLGAILCQLLTLRPPVEGKNIDEVLGKVSRGEIAWPATFTLGAKRLPHLPFGRVPESLNAIVKKAMSLRADDRYQTVGALQADVVSYQNGFATSVEQASSWKHLKLLVKRNMAASIAAAAGIVILAIASAIFTARVIRERDRAEAGELAATQQRDAANWERLKSDINAEAAQLVNLAQTDAEDALIRSVVNVEKCKRALGEVTAPVAYGLTAALESYRILGSVPSTGDAIGKGKVCAWASSARQLVSFNRRVWFADLDRNRIQANTWRFQYDPIEHLAVTGNAKLVALAGNDTTLRLWDSTDDKLTRTWTAHTEWIRAVAFSEDDKLLFSASADGSLKTWDLEGREAAPEAKLDMDGQKVGIAAIGDSGRTMVAVGDSVLTTHAQIFVRENVTDPVRRITVSGHSSRITAAAVSPDGERIATGDGDGTIRVWSRDGKLIGGPSQLHRGMVEAIAFDPDGECIASRESSGTAVISTIDGIVIHGPFPTGRGRNLAYTGDGRLVVDSQVIDALGLESAPPLNLGPGILDIAQSKDGSLLSAIDATGIVRIWKMPGRELISEKVVAPGRGKFVTISPDNTLVAACLRAETTVHFIRTDGAPARAPLDLKGEEVIALRFHATSGRLMIATSGGSLLSFDPAKEEAPVQVISNPAVDPDGGIKAGRQAMLVSFRAKNFGQIVTTLAADGQVISRITSATGAPGMTHDYPSAMDISPSGDFICMLGNEAIQVRSFPSLAMLGTFPAKSWRVIAAGLYSVAALNAARLAVGNGDGGVRILNTSGEPISPWMIRDRKSVDVLLFDPARDLVLASGREGRIRFWETSERNWMAQAARKLSQSRRIQRPVTPLDSEAARIVAANLTEAPRIEFHRSRKAIRREPAPAESQLAPPADEPGLTRVPGVPFALKIPDGWVAIDPLKIAFVDKLMRTMVFGGMGREISIVARFLPKDASIMQVTGSGDAPFTGIFHLNGGRSPAELGVFARKGRAAGERFAQVLGSIKTGSQTSRDGLMTSWNDTANTAAASFEGKASSGKPLLCRAYYLPTRQGTYLIAGKFVGETAAQSLVELDRSVTALRLPEALRVDAAFVAGFRKEIEALANEESVQVAWRNARAARDEKNLPEAIVLMERAAGIAADLATKRPSEAGRWTLEQSRILEQGAEFCTAKNSHVDALRVAELALEKATDAMQRLNNGEARLNLANCHLRKATAAVTLGKLSEAAAALESAASLHREEANKRKNPAHLRSALFTAMKLIDVRADMKDAEGLAQVCDDATTDLGALAVLNVKDAFETFPSLLDRVKQRRGATAGGSMLRDLVPKFVAANEGATHPPDVLVAGIKSFVRVAGLVQATPEITDIPAPELCRHAERLGDRLKAIGPLSSEAEFWMSGARTVAATLRSFPMTRDPKATKFQLDLSKHYNGALDLPTFGGDQRFVLRALPDGLQTFDGILFDVRGIVQGASASLAKEFKVPGRFTGIPVGQHARRIHFLHGCRWNATQPDVRIGSYILNYADGQIAELPIVYGKDVRDWNVANDHLKPTPDAKVAWTGFGGESGIRLFHRAYDNPRPDAEITSLDFISSITAVAPFVIGITVEGQ